MPKKTHYVLCIQMPDDIILNNAACKKKTIFLPPPLFYLLDYFLSTLNLPGPTNNEPTNTMASSIAWAPPSMPSPL